MIVNAYVTIDPNGDRPYISTHPPNTLNKKPGIKVYHYLLDVPDTHEPDNLVEILVPEEEM